MSDRDLVVMQSFLGLLGRLCCRAGLHDFRVLDRSFGFGGGSVETVECRRCGTVVTRRSR